MKKLLILLLLAGMAVGGFYSYKSYNSGNFSPSNPFSSSTDLRDKALARLSINISEDQYSQAFYVTADWECELGNPPNSSVQMDIVITETEDARDKVVIGSTSIKGLSSQEAGTGSLACHIKRKEITPSHPFLWAKITCTINGQRQKTIVKSFGKFK
jgi:hypothetical protein